MIIIASGFISLGCHNKLPPTWWLQTTEIYSVTVLKPWSFQSSRGGLFLASFSFWWLLVFLGSGRIMPVSASVSTWPLPLCLHLSSSSIFIGFRIHPHPDALIPVFAFSYTLQRLCSHFFILRFHIESWGATLSSPLQSVTRSKLLRIQYIQFAIFFLKTVCQKTVLLNNMPRIV